MQVEVCEDKDMAKGLIFQKNMHSFEINISIYAIVFKFGFKHHAIRM